MTLCKACNQVIKGKGYFIATERYCSKSCYRAWLSEQHKQPLNQLEEYKIKLDEASKNGT